VTNTQRVIAVVVFGVALALLVTYVRSSNAADLDKGAWFNSLKMPGSGTSCCSIADCKQVDSEWRNDGWWALAQTKGWISIPDGKIIKNKPNIMERAILCTSPGDQSLYCFLPPDMGT